MLNDEDLSRANGRTAQELEDMMVTLRAGLAPATFGDGFSDRVLVRLHASKSPFDALPSVFVRVAPLALAATVLFAAMNLFSTRTSKQPVLERVFGVPTLAVASTSFFDDDLSRWGVGTQ